MKNQESLCDHRELLFDHLVARRRTTSGKPKCAAVFMLSTTWYLAGACTGRSTGHT